MEVLLQQYEVDGDVEPLARQARAHGVPDRWRARVWPILLGRQEGGREVKERRMEERGTDGGKDGAKDREKEGVEAGRECRRAKASPAVESAILHFLQHPSAGGTEFSPGMLHVAGTLAEWVSADALPACFEQCMRLMLAGDTTARISDFLTGFATLMPSLATYFRRERVSSWGEEWILSWMQWWCARELHPRERARLWDVYFACDDADAIAEMHVGVCLALLRACRDALEELEASEIRMVLTQIPPVDMGQMVQQGQTLRRELQELEREDETWQATS